MLCTDTANYCLVNYKKRKEKKKNHFLGDHFHVKKLTDPLVTFASTDD